MKDFTNKTEKTNEQIRKYIEEWLINKDKSLCPFKKATRRECSRFCRQVFPRLDNVKRFCPCSHYTLGYVTSVAKQAVKALSQQ